MKSRNFSPVGKMGAGRPMSRGSRARSQTAPKASVKPFKTSIGASLPKGVSTRLGKPNEALARRFKSAMSQAKNRGTKAGRSMAGVRDRVRMASLRRSGRI